MTRDEYQIRQREMSVRGESLPQSKLTDEEVHAIRDAAVRREVMRREITNTLSNDALAKTYGMHPRTIEKVLSFESWGHI